MFDIIRSIKKITGLNKSEQSQIKEPEQPSDAKNTQLNRKFLEDKIDKLSNSIDNFWANIVVEYRIVKEKLQDLSQANYDLGIRYLEEGNIKEAIFRFKITKKFWPNNYEAYYELIYCLILDNKFEEAQRVIDELLLKNPSYKDKIDQLLYRSEEPELEEEPESEEKANLENLDQTNQKSDQENPNQK